MSVRSYWALVGAIALKHVGARSLTTVGAISLTLVGAIVSPVGAIWDRTDQRERDRTNTRQYDRTDMRQSDRTDRAAFNCASSLPHAVLGKAFRPSCLSTALG